MGSRQSPEAEPSVSPQSPIRQVVTKCQGVHQVIVGPVTPPTVSVQSPFCQPDQPGQIVGHGAVAIVRKPWAGRRDAFLIFSILARSGAWNHSPGFIIAGRLPGLLHWSRVAVPVISAPSTHALLANEISPAIASPELVSTTLGITGKPEDRRSGPDVARVRSGSTDARSVAA